jgi:hypothetical protein
MMGSIYKSLLHKQFATMSSFNKSTSDIEKNKKEKKILQKKIFLDEFSG